ncbi:hypothetical protein [Borrelia hermsii]|uniref:Lipoprotein n=3 Tax=Borrelia hermsii TaxID=140 RepID=A0AAN0X602_BORHE|nr:hypothetical protein [Borrelia hermsii]AAX16647.1 hypothetical protein BH0125 [Borrelia hermsii DAH]AJW72954.1 hypothetical protein L283_00615 [Borrelia hermsii CC1]AMR75690.1 hypothetical protein A0V01_03705 [Borrelia hermsii]ANA42947.1 hypothetical protein AXX13_00620 [Borrelia hermsii HS1]UCP01162.1 hypothetical protein K9R62_00625 [Borrelia hermsii]
MKKFSNTTFVVISLLIFGCGIEDIAIIDSPLVVDSRASRDTLAFKLPSGYFNNHNNSKIRGFDIYYKFYPEGSNYHFGSFTKSVQRDFDALKSVFNNVNEFNRRGFYKINLDGDRSSGRPTLKLDKSWIQGKFPLYIEFNFENLRKSTPGSVFISIRNGSDSSAPLIKHIKTIYRSYVVNGLYSEFSEALKKSKVADSDKRPFDLKHISDNFFTKDVSPKYNLVIFVMAAGNAIEDELYSVIVNIGSLNSFELSN